VDTTRQDFIVGLVIVTAIAIVIGTLLATSGWGERRYHLYLRAANAEGLTSDSKVVLQGLEVGRVVNVSPRADSITHNISFVAKLSVIERFPSGASLRLPVGTRAQLEQASQISPAVLVRLVLPDSSRQQRVRSGAVLAANDTIDSDRQAPLLAQVAEVAKHLSQEVEDVLHTAHQTLTRVTGAVAQANAVLADVRPSVESMLRNVDASLTRVNHLVQRLDPGLADSVSTAITLSNRLLVRLDSLARTAGEMTAENRDSVRTMVVNLTRLTRQMNHLADEVSRRPYRMITGVKPLAEDSAPARHASDPPKDSTHQ